MTDKLFEGLAMNTNILSMHLMILYFLRLDGLESSSANMECQLFTVYSMTVDVGKYLRREMKTGCRSCYRTLYL